MFPLSGRSFALLTKCTAKEGTRELSRFAIARACPSVTASQSKQYRGPVRFCQHFKTRLRSYAIELDGSVSRVPR